MKYILRYKTFFVSFALVVIIGIIFSLTYANDSEFSSSAIEGNVVSIDELTYNKLNINTKKNKLIPILDKNLEISNNVIKLNFFVGGAKENNIDNIVYDISLVDLELDCDLLSPYLKWKLLKNGELLSEGSLDYKFDTIENGRLVLTPIQQDLIGYSEDKSLYDEYDFYMWISDSCQEESLFNCKDAKDQSSLVNKTIKGKISIELNVGAKKELVRNPSNILNTESCINR